MGDSHLKQNDGFIDIGPLFVCMGHQKKLAALSMAFKQDKNISFLETDSGNSMSDVVISDFTSVSGSVERLVGEDGAGVTVCFDIVYEDDSVNAELKDVLVRRGRAKSEYGSLSELTI